MDIFIVFRFSLFLTNLFFNKENKLINFIELFALDLAHKELAIDQKSKKKKANKKGWWSHSSVIIKTPGVCVCV